MSRLKLRVVALVLVVLAPALECASVESTPVLPEESVSVPLLFSQWKRDQVTEAHNYAVRVRNRLLIAGSHETRGSQSQTLASLEQELEAAQQRLAIAQELSLDDYFEIYLKQFKNEPRSLQLLAERLPPEEVLKLLARLLDTPIPQPEPEKVANRP